MTVAAEADIEDLQQQVTAASTRLANQRKAMLHILDDYEQDRRRLLQQAERLDNSRRALLHILQDQHVTNQRLERTRTAMIHIMGDLRATSVEMEQRERDLREKQEQLVQAGKLATLGELTTGVAHELNNPLNNIGLLIGNVIDLIEYDQVDHERMLRDLRMATQQVRKATEIISHLRTFGRAAPVSREPVSLNETVQSALSLLHEQLRLREIELELDLSPDEPVVIANPIQLEQVFLNLVTNARDALADAPRKLIGVSTRVERSMGRTIVRDSGKGIPPGMERRIFDPFFTTKEVGKGTGLGLSITYGIIRDHDGTISVENYPGEGACFTVDVPLAGSQA
jgi:C4-dicarboxylate-specific signal transduction histidine kinase